jgi:CO/xanthine dehydrogenase FAD-binding subunit
MLVSSPRSLEEALAAMAAAPDSVPLAGGTDLMVAINFGRLRPERVVSLRHVAELKELRVEAGLVRVGAGVTYTRLQQAVGDGAMLQAARTVGSPQIRNAGTLGGNLGTASPAGDTLPVLAALDATVVVASTGGGERRVPFREFMQAPRVRDLRPGELILAAEWAPAGPGQAFLKAGTRNAMVIAVANLALVVDRVRRRVGLGLGSVGPRIIRPEAAERFAEGLFQESGWETLRAPSEAARRRFGELVAEAAQPIDDVRGTLAYRRHVLAVMAARALERVCRSA